MTADRQSFAAAEERTLAAEVRAALGLSWNAARDLCTGGKVFVDGQRRLDPSERPAPGAQIEVRRSAPRPLSERAAAARQAIVFEDSQVVVIDKPAGISSVPYERGETDTAMDLIREAWRAQGRPATATPLHIVHRIDKETSGLLVFAKTRGAERALQQLLRAHDMERRYLCIAEGQVRSQTIESRLLDDRGDGLRGSARPHDQRGKRAVTHVTALEDLGGVATLCEVQLETGKTHQIRIHLSEAGHPLVGERVYCRDFLRHGHEQLPAQRLMLHAATLGFVHPSTERPVHFRSELPPEFQAALADLGRRRR